MVATKVDRMAQPNSLETALAGYAAVAQSASIAPVDASRWRSAAESLHALLLREPVVPVVRTLPLVRGPVPSRLLFGGSVKTRWPFVMVRHRALLVQFFDAGALRTMLWNPTDVRRALRVAAFDPLRKSGGRWAAALSLDVHASADAQLGALGLSPDTVDIVAFDQLDGQDPSSALARFPRARLAVTRSEWMRWSDPSPHDRAFVVRGPELDARRVDVVEHAMRLGDGVALVRTGGRRAGHQALVMHTAVGVLVASANAFALDGYAPRSSKLSGLAAYARARDSDFVPAFPNVGEGAERAMRLENVLADRLREAPVWPLVIPTVELVASRISPGVRPSAAAPDLTLGTIVRSRVRRA